MPGKIEEFDHYIKVTLSGESLNVNEIGKMISSVMELCDQKNKNCLVYREEYSEQKASITDYYGLSKLWAKLDKGNHKYAMVFPQQSAEEGIEFMQIASRNRTVNVKLFDSLADAEAWLENQDTWV